MNHSTEKNTKQIIEAIISKVEESCLENISRPAETLQIEGELEVSTNLVEYSGTSEIEGKDLKKHIAILSEPANFLAIE